MNALVVRLAASLVLAGLFVFSPTATALSVEVERQATELGTVSRFRASTDLDPSLVEFRWTFGDGTRTEFTIGDNEVEYLYPEPGHYAVNVLIRQPENRLLFANDAFIQTVYRPLRPGTAKSSSTIVHDAKRNRIYNVNPDNDTVSVVDAAALTKVAEIPVYLRPEALALAPDGKLWVLHKDDYAIAIVDPETLAVVSGFRLPYASQPMGLVIADQERVAYVSLQALGKVLKIDVDTQQVLSEAQVGSWARGLALSHDESTLYVTRFISERDSGKIVKVDTQTLLPVKTIELAMDPGPDTDRTGRGLPNYLFSAAISPDGSELWVPAKKDNIQRGLTRDREYLNQDNIVRPLVTVSSTASDSELMPLRMDLDDRNLPTQVLFSPLGDYAFVVVTGSGFVDVREMYGQRVSKADLKSGAKAPRGAVLTPDGKLFLHSFLTRSLIVLNVTKILKSEDFSTQVLADIPVVASDKLTPEQLLGKRVFYDSEDKRMTNEGYISCASCHFDGFEDGRVWDFTQRGEGLRNTTSLLGRRGTAQGRVHWTGNFDEIQDFEHDIRGLFGGGGFIEIAGEGPDAGVENLGSPLGEPLAGRSPELDALAAFVASLDTVNRSPHRNSDGTLTAEARAGRAIFRRLGCDFCHGGADFTDSANGLLHDVGTAGEFSGQRLGGELSGFDSPTLLGVWETAPYLHDGSSPDLKDALVGRNTTDKHGFVSSLSSQEVDQLVAYVSQIDHGKPPTRLPFEAEPQPFVADDAFDPVSEVAPRPVLPEAPGQERGVAADRAGSKAGGCATQTPGSGMSGFGLWFFLAVWAAIRDRSQRKLDRCFS